jgi:hypothetical protein
MRTGSRPVGKVALLQLFFLNNGKMTGSSLSSLGGMAALLQSVLKDRSKEQHNSDQ